MRSSQIRSGYVSAGSDQVGQASIVKWIRLHPPAIMKLSASPFYAIKTCRMTSEAARDKSQSQDQDKDKDQSRDQTITA